MGLPNIGPVELIIILVIALLILGPGKLPEVGSAFGKTIKEFRKASSDITETASIATKAGRGRHRRGELCHPAGKRHPRRWRRPSWPQRPSWRSGRRRPLPSRRLPCPPPWSTTLPSRSPRCPQDAGRPGRADRLSRSEPPDPAAPDPNPDDRRLEPPAGAVQRLPDSTRPTPPSP